MNDAFLPDHMVVKPSEEKMQTINQVYELHTTNPHRTWDYYSRWGTPEENPCDTQARLFLEQFGMKVTFQEVRRTTPSWSTGDHTFGLQYLVSMQRKGQEHKLEFNFWNSWMDAYRPSQMFQERTEEEIQQFLTDGSNPPTAYDIVSMIRSNADFAGYSKDDIYEELGPITPSRVDELYQEFREWGNFFTQAELDWLEEKEVW